MKIEEYLQKYYSPKTLEEFTALCGRHDWFYYMSDMNLSERPSQRLRELAEQNDDAWKRAYNAAHALRFNTESFYPASDTTRHYEPPFKLEDK